MDGLSVVTIGGKKATRIEHCSGKVPDFGKHLQMWGEAGIVKVTNDSAP